MSTEKMEENNLEAARDMRKIVLYIAMSLDGYIADANGGVSWLRGQALTVKARALILNLSGILTQSSWAGRHIIR